MAILAAGPQDSCSLQAMAFGALPDVLPSLHLQGKAIAWTDEHQYLGVPFHSRSGGLFRRLYEKKSITARRTANVALRLQKHFGDLPPAQGLTVYKARVASHLTYAAEVAIGVSPPALALLESVETHFLRRILHVHDRSRLAILYSETGVIPLRFKRLLRPLKFLRRLLALPDSRLAVRCLRTFVLLWRRGAAGQLGDIAHVLQRLRIASEDWLTEFESIQGVDRLITAVHDAADGWIEEQIGSKRLPMMVGRRQRLKGGSWSHAPALFRLYLLIRVPAHRHAITRLVTGSHHLAVEAYRSFSVDNGIVQMDWRTGLKSAACQTET